MGAMREEALFRATGADVGQLDMLRSQPGQQKLLAVGLPDIQAQALLLWQLNHLKNHRFGYQLAEALLDWEFLEGALAQEKLLHLVRDLVAAGTNRWTYAGANIGGTRTKLPAPAAAPSPR